MSLAEDVVSNEVCEAEFARFLEAMDLHVEVTDPDDKKSLAAQKDRIFRAMRRGLLTIDTSGQPVYKPQSGAQDPIVFHEPTGATYMATDKKGVDQDVKKAIHMMADHTGQPADRFAKMLSRDFKVCEALLAIFLAG